MKMKRCKYGVILALLMGLCVCLGRANSLNVYASKVEESKSSESEKVGEVKYKDISLKSIRLGDKECYYCIFSSNEDVVVSIDDITYKGSGISGVQNYRLDNIPKLKETENKDYDRYNLEDNEYAFIKFKDVAENDKKVYIYFAQMPFGIKTDKFKESEYIVSVGEPRFNDFELDGKSVKYKYYDGSYAKGWTNIDEKIYYFNEISNEAQSGWMQDTSNGDWYYFDDKNIMVTGLKEIEGKKYWFSDNGKMLVNTTAPDGKTIDENGVYIENDNEETNSSEEEE